MKKTNKKKLQLNRLTVRMLTTRDLVDANGGSRRVLEGSGDGDGGGDDASAGLTGCTTCTVTGGSHQCATNTCLGNG